jgi:hypothetical protein
MNWAELSNINLNFFTTPLGLLVLSLFVRSWIKKSSIAHKLELDNIGIKMDGIEAIHLERHHNLCDTVSSGFSSNTSEHSDMWNKINHHDHRTTNGRVVDTRVC